MSQKLTDIIHDLNETCGNEINDVCKEYAAEKITREKKNESIASCSDIASFRIVKAVKTSHTEVLASLKKEKFNPAFINRVEELLNEQL